MSGLPYFPMYPSDFEAKTSHLTITEDGAYNRLLRLCWMTAGCSLPADEAWVMRRVRAHSDEEKEAVRVVLAEFFTIEDGRYSNARLRREWDAAKDAYEKRKNAGSKGGKAKALKNNDLASSNARARIKQPEPELEPDIPTGSVPKGTGENADFHKRALFGNGVKYLVAHGRKESEARAIIGRWLKDNSKESVFNAFAAAKEAEAVEPVSYIGRILKGRANERFDAWGIPDLNADTRTRGHTDRDDSWDAPVYMPKVQSSEKAGQQASEVPVCDELEEWMRVDVPSLRVVGGNG